MVRIRITIVLFMVFCMSPIGVEVYSQTLNWKDHAVIYGISPYYLGLGQDKSAFELLRRRVPEIKALGATVIWLQPIFEANREGQGYDVVDYFQHWPRLGTESELRRLIKEIHEAGLKVIFDIPLGQSSIHHPYAQDVIKKGRASQYYDWYLHKRQEGAAYASLVKLTEINGTTFAYYFWEDLLPWNVGNSEVQKYLISAAEHWVRNFDIDGYRFDASWIAASGWPGFYRVISKRLRSVKPDVLLLAEDKNQYPPAYSMNGLKSPLDSGFDLAYDWTNSEEWVSQWSMQVGLDHHESLFNLTDEATKATRIKAAIAASLDNSDNPHGTLRFIQNNDTPSFNYDHSPSVTRLAATLMFILPGKPMLFYGQEIDLNYPQWSLPSFDVEKTIRDHNVQDWEFYRELIRIRQRSDALKFGNLRFIDHEKLNRRGIIAFERVFKNERVIVVLNLSVKNRSDFDLSSISDTKIEKNSIEVLFDTTSCAHAFMGSHPIRSGRAYLDPSSALIIGLTD